MHSIENDVKQGEHCFLDDTLASAGDSCDSLQVTGIPRQRRHDGALQLKCCCVYKRLCRER